MEINQMLKRQEHFFQSQKTKKYEFRKKALLRLECAIKQHEEDSCTRWVQICCK